MGGKLTRGARDLRARTQADPLAWLVREVVREMGTVEASSSVWLHELQRRADEQARQALPARPEQLGRRFSELSEGLELLGVILSSHRTGERGRFWRAETIAHREARRHLQGQEQERRKAQTAHAREVQAHLRAAKSLARELRRRDARRAERAERKKR